MKNKKTTITRRGFLKALGAGGAGMLLPGAAIAAQGDGLELASLLDISQCIGCGACVDACRETNGYKYPEPEKPFPKMYPSRVKAADWSDKREVDDRLTPYNWLYIQTSEVEYKGEVHELNIPRRCLHCQNPPCANLCPWGAAARRSDGVVRINDKICLGGSKCKSVCPWNIPERQTGVGLYLDILPSLAGNGVMYKCDRCYQRLDKAEVPACIEACPQQLQQIGPRDEMVAKAHALAKEMDGFIYGETENGGTNTIYVSPVPFELLNQAVEKGPGKPHLNKVGDMMADEENLAVATLIAPFAGLAAGLLTVGSKLMSKDREGDDES